MSYIFLGMVGFDVQIHNTVLSSEDFTIIIIDECTAVGPILLLTGAIIGYTTNIFRKLVGIIMGSIMLLFLNQVRIVNLVWIDIYYPNFMDFAHLVVWQGIIVISAIVFWFVWSKGLSLQR